MDMQNRKYKPFDRLNDADRENDNHTIPSVDIPISNSVDMDEEKEPLPKAGRDYQNIEDGEGVDVPDGFLVRAFRRLLGRLPDAQQLHSYRMIRPFAKYVARRELWRFTRRSVPRGAAVGFLTAIIILVPGFQLVVAALLSVPFRANIPIALAVTFVNTPLTTPPLLIVSYKVGEYILQLDKMTDSQPIATHLQTAEASWILQIYESAATLGPTTVVGLLVIAVIGAAISYLIAAWVWRGVILQKRRRQKLCRARRLSKSSLHP